MKEKTDLLRASRAGDTFHYRWAARRCLKLLAFDSSLEKLVIEGSSEPHLSGECVIDVAEYSRDLHGNSTVDYFQLKHSLSKAQLSKPFTLSTLKDTIIGFSKRFKSIEKKDNKYSNVGFFVVTNRPVSDRLKKNIKNIADGKTVSQSFLNDIEKHTKLSNKKLKDFCKAIKFVDSEGDYKEQRYQIKKDLSRISGDIVDPVQINELVEMVREKLDPENNNFVIKEDVLKRFGFTSDDELFPAPPLFEKLENLVCREQNEELYDLICKEVSKPIIIKANGGVGKSIICGQLSEQFKKSGFSVAYDCFGNGSYRKVTEHRHRPCHAYLQVINEIAKDGLCEPLIPGRMDQDSRLTKTFLARISDASKRLREESPNSLLVIFFDAVDNAEMAASDFGDKCFASTLIREEVPEGCRIVFLCRPERTHLFNPPPGIPEAEIKSFSDEEAFNHLRVKYPQVSSDEASEFNRLTSGNPRVQSNSLSQDKLTVGDMLLSLGPGGTTVEEIIEGQLNTAVNNLIDSSHKYFSENINSICIGLATLPPFIPLEVLAEISGCSVELVKSFVSDLGRPLWLTDSSVQFRDEPTETWFKNTFIANEDTIKKFIKKITPLVRRYSYVAESLPSLQLMAGMYDELISLALSDRMLPEDNPVDLRRIRLYRLQFAFKAALKKEKYADSIKIAMRAGEEVAGDEREKEILKDNVDLVSLFLSENRVQEISYKKLLSGGWDGSENIYSSALLSNLNECKGEARSYLRSSNNWLRKYFEERERDPEQHSHDEKLKDEDIVEMGYAYYNLHGVDGLVEFAYSWKPEELAYRIINPLVSRLADISRYDAINEISIKGIDNPYIVIAATNELRSVGIIPDRKVLVRCLNKIINTKTRLDKPRSHGSISTGEFITFFESCVLKNLPSKNIKRGVNYYVDDPTIYSLNSDHNEAERSNFLRVCAIQAAISKDFELDYEKILPKSFFKKVSDYEKQQELDKAKSILKGMLPWYMIRARLLSGEKPSLYKLYKEAEKSSGSMLSGRYQEHDPIPYEITNIKISNLVLKNKLDSKVVNEIAISISKESIKFRLADQISTLRLAYRCRFLNGLAYPLELVCQKRLEVFDEHETPIDRANWFISLSRATLSESKLDSAAYFDKAIDMVSRFGDEIVERWVAVQSIVMHSCDEEVYPETAFRYMRCCELVGEVVYEEDHWDRGKAIEVGFDLSPSTVISYLSRWKDRHVGWHDDQLVSLIEKIISSQYLSPGAIWSLTAFLDNGNLTSIAKKCISQIKKPSEKLYVLKDLMFRYSSKGVMGEVWNEIEDIAKENGIENHYSKKQKLGKYRKPDSTASINDDSKVDDTSKYTKIISKYNIFDPTGLQKALQELRQMEWPKDNSLFWKAIYESIRHTRVAEFIKLLSETDFLSLYEIRLAFEKLPDQYKSRPSVKNEVKRAVYTIVRKFPDEFVHYRRSKWILKDLVGEDNLDDVVKKAIIEALSDSANLESASTFYGYAASGIDLITKEEAKDLTNYVLERFEVHMSEEFSDGSWGEQFSNIHDAPGAISGYIWSSLGSPRASERWRAAHVVRRLYEQFNQNEIDHLINYMVAGEVKEFGFAGFPFYKLHAIQYLLFALARCAVDDASGLVKYAENFYSLAVNSFKHYIIQKYARDICFSVQATSSGVFTEEQLSELKKCISSPFPIKDADRYQDKFDSPWHVNDQVETDERFWFSYDFDRYWFDSLGDVFGISSKQIQDLAQYVVLTDWGVEVGDSKHIDDPRNNLWNSYDRETWHSHFEYPRTDNYQFYLSYHSMLSVASKLLEVMPLLKTSDWVESPFEDWVERHSLTRDDGKWLSDRRDPFPEGRRVWDSSITGNEWLWSVVNDDFYDVLFTEKDNQVWPVVSGMWNEYSNGRDEEIYITSRLVPVWASQSLMNTINTRDDDLYYRLASYDDDDYRESDHPFKMIKWITRADQDKKLDEFDPFSGDIYYPPYHLIDDIAKELNIEADSEKRSWREIDSKEQLFTCEIWSEDKVYRRNDDYISRGEKMTASLDVLREACEKIDADIIIEVQIQRSMTDRSYRGTDDDSQRKSICNKIFVISKDGRIRDSRRSFKIREKVGR